jgi:hypothetical protein
VLGHIWSAGYTLLTLDVIEKKMETCSTNSTFKNLVPVKGKLYTPHSENFQMTLLTQEVNITIKGITLEEIFGMFNSKCCIIKPNK